MHPGRGEEPRYNSSKSKPSLPNENPCDGLISCLCPCVYLGMYLYSCANERVPKVLSLCVEGYPWISISGRIIKAGLHMHVLRFPCLALGHSLLWFNHFIMLMEIGFNFPFLLAEWWIILTLAVREKMTASASSLAAPRLVHKHRSYLWRQWCCVIKNHHSLYIMTSY